MKKLVRKLFISSLAMVFALVAVGTTTFAWFTTSSKAEVETVTFEVKGNESILVSVDGTNFTTDLTKEDLYKAINAFVASTDNSLLKNNGDNPTDIGETNELADTHKLDAITSEWFSTKNSEGKTVAFAAGSTAMLAGAKEVPTFYSFDAKANTLSNINSGIASKTTYYAFNIYVQNASAVPVYLNLNFDFEQLKEQLTTFVLAADALKGEETDYEAGKEVTVSLLNALRFGYVHDGYALVADDAEFSSEEKYYVLDEKNVYQEAKNITEFAEDTKYYVKGYAVSDLYGLDDATNGGTGNNQGEDQKSVDYHALNYVHNIYQKNNTYKDAWKHYEYKPTEDEDIVAGKAYYTEGTDDYLPVENPTKGSLDSYYEKVETGSYIDFDLANDGIDELPTVISKTATAGDDKTTGTIAVEAKAGDLGVNVNRLASKETRCYTFYLWCEGWDADCFDAILGQLFNLSISFDIKAQLSS